MVPVNLDTEVSIPLHAQPVISQRYSVWNKITSLPPSKKGLLIALSVQSVCSIVASGGLFLMPDPPQDNSLLYGFVDTPVISANCHKWSLLIGSLASSFATGLVFTLFLQEDKETTTNAITPEIASAIQGSIERKLHSLQEGSTRINMLT